MPWCDDCSHWFSPNALGSEGECPKCGTEIGAHPDEEIEDGGVPWHLWVLLAGVALYLGWRVVQGAGWVAGQF